MASNLIGALRVSLSADTAAFEKGMNRAERQAKASGTAISKALGGIKAGLAGLAAGVSIAAITDIAKRALDYASALGEVSQQLGVTTKDLQVFRYAATQAGISQEEMDKALARLTKTMGDAQAGSKSAAAAFGAIGISVDDLKGKNAGEVIRLLADGLSKIPNAANRAAIETAIFGRAGQKLDTLLAGGSGAIDALARAAEDLGLVLSDEQIQKADQTADKLAELKTVLEARIAGVVSDNTDAIMALANGLLFLADSAGKAIIAFSNFSNVQGFRSGDMSAVNRLAGSKPGRQALIGELDQKLQQNAKDRATGRGRRTSYLGGLIETTTPADAASDAKLDAEFKALTRLRNSALNLDRKLGAGASAPPPSAGGDVNQFLAGGGGKKRGGGKSAEQLQRERERLAEEALRNTQRFESDVAAAQSRILDARSQLADGLYEQLDFERDQLQIAHEQALSQLKSDTDLTEARRAELVALEEQQYILEADIINKRENVAREQEAASLIESRLRLEQDIVGSQTSMARTATERRALEMRLLDLQYKEEEARLKTVTLRNGANAAEVQAAQNRLAALPTLKGGQAQNIIKGTMGPMESYLDSLPRTAAEVNEAMENVAAGGISSIVDGLADAATGARSLGDVFSNVAKQIIADLIRIQIQKAIVGGITSALGGIFGGGSVSGVGLGESALSGAASLQLPKLAGGGVIVGGTGGIDTNLLSINGMPTAMVNRGESIRVEPNNDNSRGGNTYQFSGNLLTPEFWAEIQMMDASAAAQAQQGALSSFGRGQRRRLA